MTNRRTEWKTTHIARIGELRARGWDWQKIARDFDVPTAQLLEVATTHRLQILRAMRGARHLNDFLRRRAA